VPPEVFITTTDEVRKCPGRAGVTEWPEPWDPTRVVFGVVVGIHRDQVLANPVTTRTHLLSLRTPQFLILSTETHRVRVQARLLNYLTGREPALKFKLQGRVRRPRSRRPHSNPERRPLYHHQARRKRVKGSGCPIGAASNNTFQTERPNPHFLAIEHLRANPSFS
jgi:hypothetical protein